MKLVRTLQVNPALFSVVPVINVLFLVVVFFALSSRFVLQPGMAVTLPASAFLLGPQSEPRIVTVTAAPVPSIYFQDQRVSFEELRTQLSSGRGSQRSLVIKADQGTPYDLVVQIMNEGLKQGFSVLLATSQEKP